jgi:hypothetical protein
MQPSRMRSAAVAMFLLPVVWGCRKEPAPSSHADVAGIVRDVVVDASDVPARVAPAPATDVAPPADAMSSTDAAPPVDGSVDPAWQEVLAAAKSALPAGEHATLDRALDRLAPFAGDLEERLELRRRNDDGTPLTGLPPEVLAAVDDLQAWQRGGGGLDTSACDDPNALRLRTLARAALQLSYDAPDDPNLRAVLYLAQRLREEGPTLLQVMLGAALGDEAVARWKIKPGDARRVFAAYAPSAGFLLRAVAAEGTCVLRNAERALGPEGDSLRAGLTREYGLATEGERQEFLRAEVEAVRRYEVDLLRATRAWLADPTGAADDLDGHVAEAKREPKAHPILAVVAIPLGRRLRELAEARARYLTFVQGGP